MPSVLTRSLEPVTLGRRQPIRRRCPSLSMPAGSHGPPAPPQKLVHTGGIGGRTACSRIRAAGRGLERLPGRGAPKACDLTAQPQSDDKVSWGAKLVAATSPLWYQSVEYRIVANDGTLKFSLFCRWRCGHFPADPKRATPRIYLWGRVFPGSIYVSGDGSIDGRPQLWNG